MIVPTLYDQINFRADDVKYIIITTANIMNNTRNR